MLGLATLHAIIFAAGVTAATAPSPTLSDIGPHVRPASAAVRALLTTGARRSPTFARLLRDLDGSDVIVYVEATMHLPLGLHGGLTFMTSAGGIRYLRVQIPEGVGLFEGIATVGHELQHALEIAAHPQVRDRSALAALYRRIGFEGTTNRFDTVAARVVGYRVRAEL